MEIIRQQWENIKDIIHNEYDITDIAFKIWVRPLQYLKCENNVVTILIPGGEPEMLDYLKKNYTRFFQEVISDMLQDSYNVEFSLEHKQESAGIASTASTPVDKDLQDSLRSANLNPKYHFENFVVGNNRMAHSVCLHVAEAPGKEETNPLFIHGGSGLGKTHLMTAIGHYIIENTDLKVVYVTSEEFMNEVIESIRNGNTTTMSRFREKYRNIDVLLIDDIQFIIGKSATQEEFFNTFNALINNGKQIVITSDKHPAHIKDLNERMRTRFTGGMTLEMELPNDETRIAILEEFAKNFDYKVPKEIVTYIASHIRSNVRELEGAYKQVYANGKMEQEAGRELDLDKAKEILKDTISSDNPSLITPSLILRGVSEYYGIDPDDITSKKRNAEIVLPRQIFMYLCRNMTDITLKGIAALLDKKDHSTVLHGVNKISDEIKINSDLRESIEAVKNRIRTY
ncbi:MAG: chromosomal replication initiator protein DnaA [Lachnospiraceae bacterium]|nr:chromosomal replication initiator protein DnaA [Lachnospiraceae bacterium]